jgi:hypothetical protein
MTVVGRVWSGGKSCTTIGTRMALRALKDWRREHPIPQPIEERDRTYLVRR